MKVTIIDYGMGNLSSVARAFETLNAEVQVTSRPADIENAEKIVLPGVGAFGQGMQNLDKLGLIGPLTKTVRVRKTPFLGICLGMQLLAKESLEQGRHPGLGWVSAGVKPFKRNGSLKTLHIGWDEAVPARPSFLFKGLKRVPYFYFVHGYHVVSDNLAAVAATTAYGETFHSAIVKENIAGVQFHPEKSQEAGLGLLKNFLTWDPTTEETEPLGTLKTNEKKTPNIRLIPTLLYNKGRLTKTVRFQIQENGIRHDVGHPVKAPMVYDAQLADELVFLDFRATTEERGIDQLANAVSEISGRVFMPLTVGGGIRTVEDIRKLLLVGADKVVVNTAAVQNPEFIREAAKIFGSQCIVVSIDAKKNGNSYEVMTHSGSNGTGMNPLDWAKKIEALGAGEILLTSIDRDGTMEGYDLELAQSICKAVKIPVIISGGAGKLEDLALAFSQGLATGAAAASIFHFRDISPIKAKAFLNRRGGYPVRN